MSRRIIVYSACPAVVAPRQRRLDRKRFAAGPQRVQSLRHPQPGFAPLLIVAYHLPQRLRQQGIQRLTQCLGGGTAKHGFGGGIEQGDAAIRAEGQNRVHRAGHDGGQPCLPFGQFALEPLYREVGVHAGQHFLVLEGFGDVIDRAQPQALDLVHGVAQGTHEDDRNLPSIRPFLEKPAGLESVDARHHHIQQDQIGLGVGGSFQRALAILRDQHVVAGLAQQFVQDAEIGRGIVHHQDDGG
jgi:hypothetical protein